MPSIDSSEVLDELKLEEVLCRVLLEEEEEADNEPSAVIAGAGSCASPDMDPLPEAAIAAAAAAALVTGAVQVSPALELPSWLAISLRLQRFLLSLLRAGQATR